MLRFEILLSRLLVPWIQSEPSMLNRRKFYLGVIHVDYTLQKWYPEVVSPSCCLRLDYSPNTIPSTLVVLIHSCCQYVVSLGHQKMPRPQDLSHHIIDCHKFHFRFHGVFCVKLLFKRSTICGAFSQCHVHTTVASHIWVQIVGTVHPPVTVFNGFYG